jgi:hypothetical protein
MFETGLEGARPWQRKERFRGFPENGRAKIHYHVLSEEQIPKGVFQAN